ncbi:PREDICTED: CDP-diacylglycerol--glycerol-3-phosphate 3-phosphatidyltransferase, mitochondrial [Ceratosolen solmsi marchali]|uniref:CDP-diacylglycerol--glycerol-3-phosphate 3-phosphatidyltransferase n=1 Tax=Ceratosolen solmsi marchali TaxID=326594 RepID=A0AAJ6YHJ6_9HYME|nr:PREDICTED: CDP-diacylglycerol--glycerol-3-phosphate 3-phosphatidyltransferase, mitochondrial [Ceratosolen solmsi marchali]
MSCLSTCIKPIIRFPSVKVHGHNVGICATIRYKMNTSIFNEKPTLAYDTVCLERSILTWLHKATPAFPVDGSKITIIYDPSEFYNSLLTECKTAKMRITLASLYLGSGKLEKELVNSIKQTMFSSNGSVKVNILLDYNRGSRGKINSKRILAPLLNNKFTFCCNIFLYHTPRLRGFLKALIPYRFNEIIGLQHMKLYLFDNTLIISGANLSNDYFCNRQDRYFLIKDCKDLCDFYCSLVERVTEFSFQLQPDGSTIYSNKIQSHPLNSSKKKFAAEASIKIKKLFQQEINKRLELKEKDMPKTDTWIFPLVQMGQLNIRHDSEIILYLLKNASLGATLRMATGYFNLTSEYRKAILNTCQANCHLLIAHPRANGFFGAKGIASGIPAAYTTIEESFFKMCEKFSQSERVQLWEFLKHGWTYHAKGLWYSLPGDQKPCFTLIGSSNFGYRSVDRDLETQIALLTKNKDLQDSLQKEYERLFNCAIPVTKMTFAQKERIPPTWVRLVAYLFRYYF